ncbi:hypothetical protein JG687_00012120 [Phytophthora cactorum]|uniref:TFIIS central domain-containing protein n=2 Tax=Phytophthora cactorum TaxID=29920 RepID=A0A8T1BGG8_9STRA|nr:hypothetical protein Pcac1_g21051 [Phytophthora cactorum]KAG2850018.1 hypothetical protein PC113_g17161 [Phytophthora cactorum]KAG2899501.1 hypothetical protein PC115_g16513 [Phytophthora cactorum]KAG6953917.1 hypothetical protein JG687_00012120 [Phytophthora cactorum]
MESPNGRRNDEEEEDDAWALELEEELDLAGTTSAVGTVHESKVELEEKQAPGSEQKKKEKAALARPSVAATLPQEVLALIISFGQVGRVCKSWSLASIAVARCRFSSRLTDILRPLDSNALAVALDVEAELYAAYGQSYSLTKAYAHKARALLFNLKDSRNVDLRNRLLSGELPSHSLVRMSGPDMANPQLARQRKEWIRKRTHEVMRDGREAEGFESDLFECRNCGSSRTRYRQWRRKAVVDRTRIIVICLRHFSLFTMSTEDYEDFFSTDLFVNRDYESQEFDFGVVKQKLLCSHAASTDHDLTGQVVWPVSAFLAWYLVAHREEIAGKNVVELGSGAGLSGLIASQFAAHTALTDGNDIVLELLEENAESNADSSKVQALPLLWGDHKSVEAFERAFPYPVDVLIGADVVCWPILVKPILQTIKYLLLRSRNPLETKFCCGFVCRAQSTEDLFFKEAVAFGFRFERIPGDAFLPTPRPADVTSNRELQLIVFTLDPQAPNWNEPVRFADAELTNLQTAC